MAGALILIGKYPELQRVLTLLTGIKGIAETSAIALMGERLLPPPGLSHREWVKFAGLDPARPSTPEKASTRKRGCRRPVTGLFVQALTMPALSAKTHDPYVGAYFQHLIASGKQPLQAVCAVMRKLLHAICPGC